MPQPRQTDPRDADPAAPGGFVRLTLRETQAFIARPRFRVLLGSGILIAALAGPFHTMAGIGFPGRLVYWGLTITLASLLLPLLSFAARRLNAGGRVHWAVAATLAALVAVPPVFALVLTLDHLFMPQGDGTTAPELLVYVSVPTVIINLIVNAAVEAQTRQAPPADVAPADAPPADAPPADADPAPSLLFERLPAALGRDVICLRAQDHYTEAVTVQGRATVLMRLSDAERHLTGFDGLRVHRSWWVNLAHVTRLERTGAGGMDITTSNGLTIPVARGQREALRAALARRQEAAE